MKVTEILFWLALSGFLLFSAAAVYFGRADYKYRTMKKNRVYITGKGMVALAFADLDYEKDRAEREMRRRQFTAYCDYIAARGYKARLMIGPDDFDEWLEGTYKRYVTNDDELLTMLLKIQEENTQ